MKNDRFYSFIEEMEKLLTPDSVYICNGSEEENQRLLEMEVARGAAVKQIGRASCRERV